MTDEPSPSMLTRPDIESFVPRAHRPPDFDAFWADVLAQTKAIGPRPQSERVALRSTPEVNVFRIHFDSLDRVRIAGWYCLPTAGPRPLPGILQLPGYIQDPPIPRRLAAKGYAVLSVGPRGKIGSNAQFNPGYPGLLTHNIVDRNTYAYRGFYMDAVKAFDFLLGRPEVDASRIAVQGASQGGVLSVVTAALCPQVRAAVIGVPYLCAFRDSVNLAGTNPYQEIADYLRLYPERADVVWNTLEYFDGLHFASLIRCPTLIYVGLQDNVCPPATGYALFRTVSSENKMFRAFDGYGHEGGKHEHGGMIDDFLAQYLS